MNEQDKSLSDMRSRCSPEELTDRERGVVLTARVRVDRGKVSFADEVRALLAIIDRLTGAQQ